MDKLQTDPEMQTTTDMLPENKGCKYRVPTLLLTKNQDFSKTPMKNFPGPFCSPQMFKYNILASQM